MTKRIRGQLVSTIILSIVLCCIGIFHGLRMADVEGFGDHDGAPHLPFLLGNGSREATVVMQAGDPESTVSPSPFFAPPPQDIHPFTFYVYDTLTEDFLPYNISQCIYNKIGKNASCGWGLETCTTENVKPKQRTYIRYRHNYNADVVQADLFLRYPFNSTETSTSFAVRVADPTKANIFVVPYASDSHCKCISKQSAPGCKDRDGRVLPHLERLIQQLTHYNETTKDKHLFLSGGIRDMSHELIQNMTLRTSKGDARHCKHPQSRPCGMIVAPTHKTLPDYQPIALQQRSSDWWTTRQRTHSLVGYHGRQDSDVTIRNEVLDRSEVLFPKSIDRLPTSVKGSFGESRTLSKERDILEAYQNSTFCLILPGDAAIGNRFYDTITSGCIPVMLKYTDNENNQPSWFKFRNILVPNRIVYPFAKGIFWDDAGIDYKRMVVEVDMDNCGIECITPMVEKVMANKTEVTRLQINLQKHAALFSYGLQENAYKTFDAFGLLLWQLGNYVHHLRESEKATAIARTGQ